uniref:APRL3 n=1 Tax=Arundo donax TaxID=35708 RepID=A0A0A9EH41_ARUDO
MQNAEYLGTRKPMSQNSVCILARTGTMMHRKVQQYSHLCSCEED